MKGSPGGILLIAVGVVLLSVGFTGRYKAVVDALVNGKSSSDTTEDKPKVDEPVKEPVTPEEVAGYPQDPVQVIVQFDKSIKVVDAPDLVARGSETGKNCIRPLVEVTLSFAATGSEKLWCALPGDLYEIREESDIPSGGGESVKSGRVMLATGVFGERQLPSNERIFR